MDQQRIRAALGKHLGHELTPERAVQIERDLLELALALAGHREPVVVGPTPTMEQILEIERHILAGPQVETPTVHYLAPGLYAREIFIPKGTVLTGDVHKVEHVATFVGDITVWTEGGMKRLTGYHTFVSKAGAKRVGFAHADTWCLNVFRTDKTDIHEIESEIAEHPALLQSNQLGLLQAISKERISCL